MTNPLDMQWIDPWDDDTPDLLDNPATAYSPLPDNEFKPEQELAEKYRSFVSEILRLSLAGVAAFSFLQNYIYKSAGVRAFACLGLVFLAVSIGMSLRFLFGASEGLRWYIVGLRYRKSNDEANATKMLAKRRDIVRRCRYDKRYAAAFLLFGAGSMAVATIFSLVTSQQ